MRAADRLVVASPQPRVGAAAAASLAVHGGALAAVLLSLGSGGVPAGQGEPQAIAMVFIAGPPAPQPDGAPEETAGEDVLAVTETLAREPADADPAIEPTSSVATTPHDAGPETAPPQPPEPETAAPPPPPPEPKTAAQPPRPAPPAPARAQPTELSRPTPPPRRAAAQTSGPPAAQARRGGTDAIGRPDASGPPAPLSEAGPVLVSNPGFRRPPMPPVYPRQAIARGIEGTAVLRVLIGQDGETIEIRIHRSSGAALLDQAAIEAVRRWAFRPAVVGGRAVAAWVEVPVRFRLE